MPALQHPIETVIIDATNVVKDPFREELRQNPREFGTAVNFRLYDLPNTPNALIGGKLFSYDAADTTTPDDGVSCILDFSNRRFKVVPVAVAGQTVFTATAVAGAHIITCTAVGLATPSATPQYVVFTPVGNGTGADTIGFNGGGALAIKNMLGTAVAANELLTGLAYLLKVTSTDVRIMFATAFDGDKGDITVSSAGTVFTIDANVVTNAKLATMATLTLKGNNTGATGNALDLTAAQAKTLLAITEGDVTNLVSDLALKAPLASPVFTGTPTAPTPSALDNTTKLATTAYVDAATTAIIAAADALVFKAVIDCSANPNYPAADRGWTYRVSVAGKIGGASGINVEVGDLLLCLTDGTASGNQATVGANWSIAQTNIDGAVVGPASAVDSTPAVFDGATGKLIKNVTFASFKTSLAIVSTDLSDFTEAAQDSVGGMIDASLNYGDATPLLQRAALTGDVTAAAGSNATTIAADAVTNAKSANMATATVKGRITAGTGDPEDLTTAQHTTLVDVFTSALKGAVPASGGGTTNYLRADGSFSAPPGTGGVVNGFINIAFTDGDTARRVTVTDAAVGTSSKIIAVVRRPDTADDSADRGYIYTANVVRQAAGSFDVLLLVLDSGGQDTTENPPNETITLNYAVI